MKKTLIMVFLLTLLLAACGNSAPAESSEPEAPETTMAEETEMPTESIAQQMEEVRALFYGTSDQMPDRAAAVAILETLADENEPEVSYLLALDAYLRSDYEKTLPLCEKAADQNYEPARVLLGEMYLLGNQVTPRDVKKAEDLFHQAIDHGCADGHIGLGDIHQNGFFGKIDLLKAAEEFETAAEKGTDPYWIQYANASLGAVMNTRYVHFEDFLSYQAYTENYKASVEYYKRAAEMWDSAAMYMLSYLYQKGLDLSNLSVSGEAVEGAAKPNPELAKEWAKKLIAFAEQTEDANACEYVGYLYQNGVGVDQDVNTALEWFEKGAKLGNNSCMNMIGRYYYLRYGVAADPGKEMEWYFKAAEAGNTLAMRNIAESYYSGISIEYDYAKAIEWFEKAAAYGDSKAMLALGEIYFERKNNEQGLQWYEKAAANGDADAMNWLGAHYAGNGDNEKAEEWFIKGVNMQHAYCMVNLARLYNHYNRDTSKEARLTEMAWKLGSSYGMWYMGQSFERQIFYFVDRELAIAFYKLAVDAGREDAKDDLKRLGVIYNP